MGVNPDRIGIMGFSAGGYVAANLGMNCDDATRPAFLGILYGPAPDGPVIQATRLFDGLKKVKAPADLHVFAKGGNGFGMRKKGVPADSWTERFRESLDFNGWLVK